MARSSARPAGTVETARLRARRCPLGAITLSGHQRSSRGILGPTMRRLGQYALVLLLDGSGRYEDANGFSRDVGPGDMLVLFPDLPHRYGPGPGQSWDEFFLVFDGPVFDFWRRQDLLDASLPIWHVEPVHQWLKRMQSVLGSPHRPGLSPPLQEVCRLQQLLADAATMQVARTAFSDQRQWLERARTLIEAQVTDHANLHQVAAALGLTYESFRKRFARWSGVSPGQYLTRQRITRATALIRLGALTDKQIADELGFYDPFHFSRRFKKVMGISPRAFRRRATASDQYPDPNDK